MHPVAPSTSQAPIAVAIIHRDPLLRLGVQATLRADIRFRIEAEPDGPAPLAGADVVVADYDTGTALARRGDGAHRVLIVTQRDSASEVQQALVHGVRGYVLIGCSLEELTDAVLSVHRGQRHLDPAVARRMADSLVQQALTQREAEVLGFIAAGWSNKMVASQLGVAPGTVKTHVKAILGKLDASSRTQAAMVAQHRGLVTAEVAAKLSYPAYAGARGKGAGTVKMAS
jgi:DNA-binding NarL/FixJ family response regulator